VPVRDRTAATAPEGFPDYRPIPRWRGASSRPVEVPRAVSAGELLAVLTRLLDDPERRRLIGDAAAAYVREAGSADATARAYRDAILATRALVLEPARMVLSRWARSLAEIGVDEQLLDEGYGASYARSLRSFTPSDRS